MPSQNIISPRIATAPDALPFAPRIGHSEIPDDESGREEGGEGEGEGNGSVGLVDGVSYSMGVAEDGQQAPALQVIVLGSGGGPLESNTTAFLVRSVAARWTKGSLIAVDAGVHLSAITRILEETQPAGLGTTLSLPHTLTEGPFSGLEVPFASPSANAAHITRVLVDTFLITHPHLDHISGFVVNTAGLGGIKPKRLAGLPSTISAFKNHIFNNVIWPNLSDENNGAGLVTYMRLVEGGSPAIGEGEGKGYLEIAEGLSVKTWGVSHGHCIEKHSHRGSHSSAGTPARYGSMDGSSLLSPRSTLHPVQPHNSFPAGPPSMVRVPSVPSHSQLNAQGESVCVYDSSAYFIRDVSTGHEVLIFGDVEPDSISLSPRNLQVWQEAAPKIAAGTLGGIFIECSYDDSQSIDRMFGHLKPAFIVEELRTLAAEVELARQVLLTKKRKRADSEVGLHMRRKAGLSRVVTNDDPVSPKTVRPRVGSVEEHASGMSDSPHISASTADLSLRDVDGMSDQGSQLALQALPLKGLKVVIIHVKEELADGEPKGDRILRELLEYEAEAQLGCEFVLSKVGQSLYL